MNRKLKPHYSGDLSRPFWKIVNNLSDSDKNSLYSAGVLLQNMETTILNWLEQAEKLQNPKKKK